MEIPDEDVTPTRSEIPTESEGTDKNAPEADTENLADADTLVHDKLSTVMRNDSLSKEECQITTGSFKKTSIASKYKYDREFLLKFQHDPCVSTKPVELPTIREIKTRRYETDICRSEQTRYKGKQKRFRGDRGSKRPYILDEKRRYKAVNEHEIRQFSEMDKMEYDGTCFVVIDFDDGEEDTKITTSSSDVVDVADANDQGNMKENKESSAIGKPNSEENKCRALSKETTHEVLAGKDGIERKRKGRESPNFTGYDKSYKRKRISSKEGRDIKLHTDTSRGRKEYSLLPRKHNHSYNRGRRVRDFRDRHLGKSLSRSRVVDTGLECRSFSDHRNDDENICKRKYSDTEKDSTVSQIALQDQFSPVSDRSISPYTDFRGFFNDNDQEISDSLDTTHTVNNSVNFKANILMGERAGLNEEKGFQNGWSHPDNGLRNDMMFHKDCFDHNINVMRENVQNNSNFYRMGFQTYPSFPIPLNYQQNQPQYSAFKINNDFKRKNPFNDRVLVPIKTFQCFRISRDSINSPSLDMKNNVIPAIYSTMVAANRPQFSPDEVIQMMLLPKPVRIEFDTKDVLIHLLKQNEDKFTVQNNGSLIALKTDVEICHIFTNNPSKMHDCMDLHICKYYLLGYCPRQQCKFSHELSSPHNKMVLRNHKLEGQKENCVKNLIRDLNSRNTSTTPLICKFYNNEGGCQKDELCSHLHLCTHFIHGDCKFGFKCRRSHNLRAHQPKVILENHGVFLNSNSNYDRTVSLLMSTLQHGGVKLKRELLNFTKADQIVNEQTPSMNQPDISTKVRTEVKEENEMLQLKFDSIAPLVCKKRYNDGKPENKRQKELPRSKQSDNQPDEGTKESGKMFQQSLPEFIPLETEIDMIVERDTHVAIQESMNTDVHMPKATLNGSNLKLTSSLKPDFGDRTASDGTGQLVQETFFLKQNEKNKVETKQQSADTLIDKSMLPPWTPLIQNKDGNDRDTFNNTATEKEQTDSKDTINLKIRDDGHHSENTFDNINYNSKEIDKSNSDSDTDGINEEQTETNTHSQAKDEDDIDNDKPEDLSETKPKCPIDLSKIDDKMNVISLMPEVLFEMKNDTSCFRVRKLQDCWQLQVNSNSRLQAEDDGVLEDFVAPWTEIETRDADILEKINHMFTSFISSKSNGAKLL